MLTDCPSIYGGTELLSEKPPISYVREATWLPPGAPHGPPGLYYPSGRVVAEALHYIGIPEPHLPIGARFTSAPRWSLPVAPDEFHYVYLENIVPHYGHFLIGALSRFWSLAQFPGKKLRFVFGEPATIDALFEREVTREIFGALGLTRENFVVFPQGARFREIEVPGASFEQNSHVHDIYADVTAFIGDRLGRRERKQSDRIVYLTKSHLAQGIWRMKDEAVFTEKLQQRGVEVYAPEQMAFRDQIDLWRDGGVFVATAGSSLHSAVFAPQSRIIALNNVPEMWSNQVLIDRVARNRARYLFDSENFSFGPGEPGFSGALHVHDMDRLVSELLDCARHL